MFGEAPIGAPCSGSKRESCVRWFPLGCCRCCPLHGAPISASPNTLERREYISPRDSTVKCLFNKSLNFKVCLAFGIFLNWVQEIERKNFLINLKFLESIHFSEILKLLTKSKNHLKLSTKARLEFVSNSFEKHL